jgi:3-phytase
MNQKIIGILILLILVSCKTNKVDVDDNIFNVTAYVETEPMPSADDAADDPCIWIHPTDPSLSTIIATYKQEEGGLFVYDLDGKILQYVKYERMNNVDLRYNFPLGDENVALVTSGNRVKNSLSIFKVNPETRLLEDVSAGDLVLQLSGVYGSCMYKSRKTGSTYVFVNDKDGRIEQWRLFDNGSGFVDGELVRVLRVDSQPEGCVADDVQGYLYVGEEEKGIWRFEAEPDANDEKILIDQVGIHTLADIEGLTIYYGGDNQGYLIASSQGNNTYVIYDRNYPNDYIGRFQIIDGDIIDGTSETDGIDVVNSYLGPLFPYGIFVVQDGHNDNGNQNLKIVAWDQIANAFPEKLSTSTLYNPRSN